MLEKITEHLQKTYKPNAILLHGSRARGKERVHSDWDFVFLYYTPGQYQNGREVFAGQNIEFSMHVLPVEDIYNGFSNKLQVAQVVYEENSEGSDLLKRAAAYYEQGVYWTKEKLTDHKIWMQGRVGGMEDNLDNPMLFAKYHADFYQRVFNYWYWVLQNVHSQPFYIAIEEVAEKDSEYFELVQRFATTDTASEQKVTVAKEICQRLFI